MMLGLQGCALKPENHNQSMFEQALVLQQISPNQAASGQQSEQQPELRSEIRSEIQPYQTNEIHWSFPAGETTLKDAQVSELFSWLAVKNRGKDSDYNDTVLLLRQGPDWLSSYHRGQSIRNLIPRALTVRQEYYPDMQPHRVLIKMVNIQGGRDE